MRKIHFVFTLLLIALAFGIAQQPDIKVGITGEGRPAIAVPDFRGAGEAQRLMEAFNSTLSSELGNSGLLKLIPKTLYPLQVPQQPSELRPNSATGLAVGWKMADWSGPPVNANYLALGYTAVKDNQIVLYGWLYNVSLPEVSNAQVLGKIYFGSLDEGGSRKVAQQFAADILQQFGGKSLIGSKIVFVSNRSGNKEIWQMDYDGFNQKPITSYRSISITPAVSPDGAKVAFMTYAKGSPQILVHSLETGRRLPFYNQVASLNAMPDFTPDSRQILFASTAGGGPAQIYIANADGSSFRRISSSRSIEVDPKVNPKTGAEIIFTSGRSGMPQLYKMNLDGADVVRLSTGEGETANPAWHPDGQHVAFAWTRGFDPGSYNIFVMDVATREVVQLTHGGGRFEHPSFAPDGIHIVYSAKRGRSTQIWTMLADGTKQQPLTTQGSNEMPVWGKSAN